MKTKNSILIGILFISIMIGSIIPVSAWSNGYMGVEFSLSHKTIIKQGNNMDLTVTVFGHPEDALFTHRIDNMPVDIKVISTNGNKTVYTDKQTSNWWGHAKFKLQLSNLPKGEYWIVADIPNNYEYQYDTYDRYRCFSHPAVGRFFIV